MIPILTYRVGRTPDRLKAILARGEAVTDEVYEGVVALLADVRARGDAALIEHTRRFDGAELAPDELRVPRDEWTKALASLPTELAALCQMNVHVHQLAVEAFLEKDIRKVCLALMMDPLTHSRLTIDEIEDVVYGLIRQQQSYLGKYFRQK